MIKLVQVSKRFAQKEVLRDFSLTLGGGETTCVLGPSGCGKTTLLRVASGLLAPDSGSVTGLVGRRASFVFQEDRLLPWLDALGNLTAIGIPPDDARQALEAMLLAGEAHTLPPDMSGGMQRRLSIARALAYGGDAFFLDEPLRGLDMATAAPVLAALRAALAGKTAMLITHSAQEAFALADTLLLVDGPPVRPVAQARISTFDDSEAIKRWLQANSPSFTMPGS